jgi:hypothetical protein
MLQPTVYSQALLTQKAKYSEKALTNKLRRSAMAKKKKKKEVSNADLYKSVRGDWNGINPVSRIVESKKKKAPKYKHKIFEE